MSDFNSEEVIREIVQKLSNRATARPFPHLRVIGPTPYGNNTRRSAIFTDFTQNPPHVVGYKVAVSPDPATNTTWSVTDFKFTVPRAVNPREAGAFEDFAIRMAVELKTAAGELTVDSSLRGRLLTEPLQPDPAASTSAFRVYRSDYQELLPIRYFETADTLTETPVSLSLHFEKRVESKSDCWTTEFKAKNLSEVRKFEDAKLVEQNKVAPVQEEADEYGKYETEVQDAECTYLSTGYLLEFELRDIIEGGELCVAGTDSPALRTFNTVATRWSNNTIDFSDHYIGEERIPKMKVSPRSIRAFARQLADSSGLTLDSTICEAFSQVFRRNSVDQTFLRVFQEEAVSKILLELKERRGLINIISVRTAGGKTEAFLIPLIQYCIDRLSQRGVKAFIFYPTKALANDQAKRFFRALYFENKLLAAQGKRPIAMALYHGDVAQELTADVDWVPFKCPKGCDVHLAHGTRNDANVLTCPSCDEVIEYCYLTRGDTHIRLPDILITNPDTLSYLMGRYADRHSILGRRLRACPKCGWTSPSINARTCYGRGGECKTALLTVTPECTPDVFIYDEVHLFSGAFGMNVAAFNRRIERMVKGYRERLALSQEYKPIRIGSSATIKSPEHFAASFFGSRPEDVTIIPQDPKSVLDPSAEGNVRYNLFLLPRAYRSKQTSSLAVKYLLDISRREEIRPRVLAFVNSLRDCNDLILETKSRADTDRFRIDGHNTQYSKEQRSDREVRFNKGELHVLFATSTLEVGIDFEDVNALVIYGPPFHFNDYLQRIGRAGRTSDAVVLTVCKANQPIDYWYFEHAGDIIKRPEAFTHRIPLGEDNPLIAGKALKLAVFDYIQQRPDIQDLAEKAKFAEQLFDKSRNKWRPEVESSLREYLAPLAAGTQDTLIDEAISDVLNKTLGFAGDPGWSLLENVHIKMNEEEGLDNMRSSERSILVQYTFGSSFTRT